MKPARKRVARRQAPRRVSPLSLSARVERLEKAFLFKGAPAAAPTAARFTNLDAAGKATTAEHVAVNDAQTGLTWAAAPLNGGEDMDYATALKACENLTLLGHKDWRAPTIQELLSIVDYERFDPAVDPAHFKGPYGFTWSSTKAKSPSDLAWFVTLYGGNSYRFHQTDHNHVRAVRAGQPG